MTDLPSSIEFDPLKLYFGDPFEVTEGLVIYQPSIHDIVSFGEKRFFQMVNPFIANTTMYRLPLWDIGIDWNRITDFDLFAMLISDLSPDETYILFREVDFRNFERKIIVTDPETGTVAPVLVNSKQKIIITEQTYQILSKYIRTMLNTFPKVEKAKGRITKESIIEEDRMNLEIAKKKGDNYTSSLLPLISSCLNHPGFKYNKQELRQIGIVEFMDSVQRLQAYESTTALLRGMYSGMVDTSKIDKNEFNFMRDLSRV